jgi:hypothetical protein
MRMARSSTPGLLISVLLIVVVVVATLRRSNPPRRRRADTPSRTSMDDRRNGAAEGPSQPGDLGQVEIGHPLDGFCETIGVICSSVYFAQWLPPDDASCNIVMKEGYQLPDRRCTPGGIDPSVTVDTLRDPRWRTRCIRNCQTSESEKHIAYAYYNLARPRVNSGEDQICELDHLVPIELGGADGMGNIWPECGSTGVVLNERSFKVKDRVENYLANEVRAGRMPLSEAQHGIADDWTQYLEAANRYCDSGGRCGRERR